MMLLPVQFITPAGDPLTAPVDAGNDPANIPDGSNQFTYSTATTGVLTVKLKAKISNISNMGSTIQGKFTFSVETVGSSTMAWDVANPNGKATVNGDFIEAKVTFTGLPQNNSNFGIKMAKVLYDGQVASTQKLAVFFPENATNHPLIAPLSTQPPNWFYYWQDGNVCGIDSNCIYDPTIQFGQTRPGTDNVMRLGPAAPLDNYGPQTFTSNDGRSIVATGEGKGIQCVAETIQHERHHLTIYNTFGLLIGQTNANETDGDAIPDASEATYDSLNTDPHNADTFNVKVNDPSYATYGDNELRCLVIERHLTIPLHPELDWANPGCQSKNQHGPKVPH